MTNTNNCDLPPSKTILSPSDWWDNLNYWWNKGGRPQGNIPSKMRAPDCYPSGSDSPTIKEFILKYQSGVYNQGEGINGQELEQARQDKNVDLLLNLMNDAWFYGPGQCGEAWDVLCDLCSECWVFDDEQVEAYQEGNKEEGEF
jgi:hypothetical protein